jgi:nicotinamidase/pyrazinamidase
MRTVFFDVDTQIDFMYPAGALYVPGAETIVDRIAELNRYAASNRIALVSTADAHSENDPEFKLWPPHCVIGTTGQTKPCATRVEGQIVFEKQTVNCFDKPEIYPLLQRLDAERYVVYGVVTEICVMNAALGLLKTGARVEIATDAVRSLKECDADLFLRNFTASGGVLTAAGTVIHQGR